jgi:eukaryotic-like serine/threonine-protein kinase
MPSSSEDRNPVERLAEEFAERYRCGERPSLAEYVERYPQHADEIREVFPALVVMEQLKPATADLTGAYDRPADGGQGDVRPLERVGDYHILREVGRGGMGVVYEAEQVSLGRHVALKVLPGHALLAPTYLERFRREARAAARLHHTNIVPVFGVGEHDGVHYYAMQFIRGEGLDRVLHDLRRLRRTGSTEPHASPTMAESSIAHNLLSGCFADPSGPQPTADSAQGAGRGENTASALSAAGSEGGYFRSVARVGRQVAEALAYAHRSGVLHRDIKPSNLLLDQQGTVWVTDFGLAKAEGADELTQTGDIVGTIRFMAPERFEGRSLPQSDVYSLGVTLYELLTLQSPFADANKARLVEKVLREPPPSPRKVNPRIPRDLETMVLKCLAKDPAERYPTAEALAEDLGRFLADRPIQARRTPWQERTWRWARRNPVVASLGGLVLLLLLVTAVGGIVMSLRLNTALEKAQEAEREGKFKLFASYVSEADAKRMSQAPGQRFDTLRRVRDALEVAREIGLSDKDRLRLRNIAIAALCLPDMEVRAEGSVDPDRPLPEGLDPLLHKRLLGEYAFRRLPAPAFGLRGGLGFSPDGRFVVAAPELQREWKGVPVRLWRVDGPQPRLVREDRDGVHEEAKAFRPDSRQVAFGHADGAVTIYDTETGERVRRLPSGPGPAFCLAFHPRLPRLAVACGLEVALWDVDRGVCLQRLPQPGQVFGLDWHPRGHRLAVSSGSHGIRLWDAESGRLLAGPWEGPHYDSIWVAFSHAGDRVASSGWNGLVRLWDSATGQLLFTLPGGGGLDFGSDDRSLIPRQLDDTWRYVRVAGGQERRVLRRPIPQGSDPIPKGSEPLLNVQLHPDGRLLAGTTPKGLVFFDLRTGEEAAFLAGSFSAFMTFDRTGALWTTGAAGLVRWPVQPAAGSPQRWRIGPPEWVADPPPSGFSHTISVSDDGRVASIPLKNAGAVVVHRGPPRRVLQLGPQYDVRLAPVSADGRWVVTASHWYDESGSLCKLWEVDTGRLVASLPYPEVKGFHGFSPDSRWLYVSGKEERRLEIASLVAASGRPEPAAQAPEPLRWHSEHMKLGGAFSPDGRLRVYGSEGSIRLVTADTHEEIARLPAAEAGGVGIREFSPDGSLLLVAGYETGETYVFNLRRIREQLAELGLDWSDVQAAFPAPAEDAGPGPTAPLEVELVEAEAATSREKMTRRETERALAALYFNRFDPDARYRLAELFFRAGKFAEAHAHLGVALGFRPDLHDAYLLRAEAGSRLKRWEEAEADATRYLDRYPENGQARLLRARINQRHGRHEAAAADLTVAIRTYPRLAQLYEQRAACYQAMGKPDLARADREQALRCAGSDPTVLNNQARRLVTGPVKERDPARALELVGRALERQPDNPLFLNTLGLAQYRNAEYAAAAATLEKSRAAGRGEWDGFDLFFLALCHARLGDPVQAQECFDQALKWCETRKGLSPQHIEELKAFRAEAEQVLRP